MSTDEILKCIEYAPDGMAEKAVNQLTALEESHAEMVRLLNAELRHEVTSRRHTDDCWDADTLACTNRCLNIHAALKKAGAL